MIGVYEALVEVNDDRARTTSRAAEPEVGACEALCYHLDCYRALQA